MALVFYDTETTGTNTGFDQILQFAAIQTDAELNETDKFDIRCRILPYISPSPGAMRVTGVTVSQIVDSSLPTYYQMVTRIREKLLEWQPATFLGYNSIWFDEHLLRQAFYKNLFPPYLTNTNGNCRTDVMRAVQAASLHMPDIVTVPLESNGQPTFKLDQMAPANGYHHELAHDALDDVRATIHLARLLDERAPDIWSAFMRFSNKATVIEYLSEETVVALSDFFFGKPYSWHVTRIGENANYAAEQYVFNLTFEPSDLERLSTEELARRLASRPKPVRTVRSNAAPFLMPMDEAPEIAATWSVGLDELERRAARLRKDERLCQRLVTAFEATRTKRESSVHVEEKIYDGFYNSEDQELMEVFHQSAWTERAAIASVFEDPRLRELGMRLIYTERPDVLDPQLRRKFEIEFARRLVGTNRSTPWLTLPEAIEQVEDLIAVAKGPEGDFLRDHRTYLSSRLDTALAHLS